MVHSTASDVVRTLALDAAVLPLGDIEGGLSLPERGLKLLH